MCCTHASGSEAIGANPAPMQRLRRAVTAVRVVGDECTLRASRFLRPRNARWRADAVTAQFRAIRDPRDRRSLARADQYLLACADDAAQDLTEALTCAVRLISAGRTAEIDDRVKLEAITEAKHRLAHAARVPPTAITPAGPLRTNGAPPRSRTSRMGTSESGRSTVRGRKRHQAMSSTGATACSRRRRRGPTRNGGEGA